MPPPFYTTSSKSGLARTLGSRQDPPAFSGFIVVMEKLSERWFGIRLPSDRVLLVMACVALFARFVALEHSPPGFSYDEAMGAANLACLGETGHSAEGVSWPLFATGAAGGFYTPVYLYVGALWTKLFGISIAAIRSVPGIFVTFTILGVHLLARRLGGTRAGFWALVLASLSPWGFQFARVAWDPPVAATFVVWFCFFWLLRRPVLGGALSGAAFAAALYSYPPARAQAPLLFGALFILTWRITQRRVVRGVAFACSSVLLSVPLVQRMLDPAFAGRGNGLAIFTSEYLKANHGIWGKSFFFVRTLLDNLSLHLRPSFLFLTGDACQRHSSQFMGELGLLDDLALVLVMAWIILRLRTVNVGEAEPVEGRMIRVLGLGIAGFFLGLLPAALTWEGLPHALRAIGAWPFVALIGAASFCIVERRWHDTSRLAVWIAGLHLALYGKTYFVDYPNTARDAFNASWNETLLHPSKRTPEARRADAQNETAVTMYFLMLSGRYNCDQAARACGEWAKP